MAHDEASRLSAHEPDPDYVLPKSLRFELVRPGLLAAIEASHDAPLVVLAAPSGFGKTTLLAQYARSRAAGSALRPAAWLSLSDDDADPSVLAARLTRSLGAAVPGLTFDRTQRAPHSALALAHDLNAAGTNVALTLDRAERLGPEAGRWLETLLGALSEGHQLLLGGFDVPVRVARLAAEGSALVLGPAQLAFRQEEAEAYLWARGFGGDAASTWASVEGWPAGLSLVAAGATPGLAPADLVIEMLDHLPPELRRALAEASVLETWSPAGAAHLRLSLPDGWLPAALNLGLPLTPLGGGVFRPHRLLREVLDAELRADLQWHAELHRRAAGLARAAGMPLEALNHYRTAGLEGEALGLAREVVPRLVRRGEYDLVRRVLEMFDVAHLPDPLASALGIALIHVGEMLRGQGLLATLRATGRADVATLVALAELARREGHVETALARLGEADGLSSDAAERALVLGARAALLLEVGAADEARHVALELAAQAESGGDVPGFAGSQHLLGVADLRLGHFARAEPSLTRALALYTSLELPQDAVRVRLSLAERSLVGGQFARALDHLAQGRAVVSDTDGALLAELQAAQGDVQAWQGEHVRAAIDYRQAIQLGEAVGTSTAPFWLRLAEAAWRSAERPVAGQALARARALVGSSAPAGQQARLAFQEGLFAFGQRDLETAAQRFSAVGSADPVSGLRARLFLAELARLQGQLRREQVAEIVAMLDAFGSEAVLHLDAELLGGLYAEFARRGWEPEGFSGRVVPPQAQLPAVALDVRSLGQLEVFVERAPTRLPFARCGELLAWLALYGPASRDRIVDALWDGEPGHLEYFRVVVRKLRMALAEAAHLSFNPLPFENGQYGLSERFEVRIDANELRGALESRNLERWQLALASYRGSFLPGVQSEWAAFERTRLDDTAFELALAVGGALETHDPAGALDAYRRAADIDGLAEGGHLGLSRVFTRLGDTAAAERAHRAYAQLLERELRADGWPAGRRSEQD